MHFEIHAEARNGRRTSTARLFGWEITKWDGPVAYWLVNTGSEAPGIEGAILRRMGENPDPQEPTAVIAYVCTIDVENVDEMIEKAKKLALRRWARSRCRVWAGRSTTKTLRATSSA